MVMPDRIRRLGESENTARPNCKKLQANFITLFCLHSFRSKRTRARLTCGKNAHMVNGIKCLPLMTRLQLSFILLGISLLPGCGSKNAAPPPPPVRPVSVAKAEAHDVPLYLEEIGNCTAYEAVIIQPQVSGRITEIHFTEGAEVKKGDRLFTIDPRLFQATLDQALATLEQDEAKATFNAAQLQRNVELSKTKVIAPQDLDNARSAAQSADAAVQADKAAVETAKINLDYCSIRSPINGRTGKRMLDIGNIVAANSTPLLAIQRQDPIYVDFTVPEGVLARVRQFLDKGSLKVEASFSDDHTKKRVGELSFLDSGVQRAT